MTFQLTGIDHVNIPIPVGGESASEAFWMGILGFTNRPKPPESAARGGRWFVRSGFEVHVSPMEPFHPVDHGHVAFRIDGMQELVKMLEANGYAPIPNGGAGGDRLSYFVRDPFGNRLEITSA